MKQNKNKCWIAQKLVSLKRLNQMFGMLKTVPFIFSENKNLQKRLNISKYKMLKYQRLKPECPKTAKSLEIWIVEMAPKLELGAKRHTEEEGIKKLLDKH